MPVYNAPLLFVDTKETRRYAGLAKAKFDEKTIAEACQEAQLLAQPRGVWETYAYDAQTQTVQATPPFVIQGKIIGKHLRDAEQVVILSATVGDNIETQGTKYFEAGRYAYALLLDAAATTAVEQVADMMEKAIAPKAKAAGFTMRWRFSPGYGDWPLTQQDEMVRLAHAKTIGVSLTEALMLFPRKSITAIIGLVREGAKKMDVPAGCAACGQKNCPSRRD